MGIVACMNIFNEKNTIEKVMGAVNPFVDRFIIVDGAYATYPYQGDNGSSDDGTLEIVEELMRKPGYNITLIHASNPWENEMVKRSQYLKHLKPGDWMLRLDGDELVVHWETTRDTLRRQPFDAYSVIMEYQFRGEPHFTSLAALYQYKKGMRYEGTHAHLVNDETGNKYKVGQLHIVLRQLRERPEERQQWQQDWYAAGLCE